MVTYRFFSKLSRCRSDRYVRLSRRRVFPSTELPSWPFETPRFFVSPRLLAMMAARLGFRFVSRVLETIVAGRFVAEVVVAPLVSEGKSSRSFSRA